MLVVIVMFFNVVIAGFLGATIGAVVCLFMGIPEYHDAYDTVLGWSIFLTWLAMIPTAFIVAENAEW